MSYNILILKAYDGRVAIANEMKSEALMIIYKRQKRIFQCFLIRIGDKIKLVKQV